MARFIFAYGVRECPHFILLFFLLFIYFLVFLLFLWAAPTAYGGSPLPRHMEVPVGAVATGLRQSHSNTGSELHLQPTPQLMATPDP